MWCKNCASPIYDSDEWGGTQIIYGSFHRTQNARIFFVTVLSSDQAPISASRQLRVVRIGVGIVSLILA